MSRTTASFASDNHAGAHPRVLEWMGRVNDGPALSYGGDEFSDEARNRFRKLLGDDVDVAFALTGTGANLIALSATLEPYRAVLCSQTAHIHVNECGATERFTGSKVIPIPTPDGKLTPEMLAPYFSMQGNNFKPAAVRPFTY